MLERKKLRWESHYHNLPKYNHTPILLVPKSIVRVRSIISHSDYDSKQIVHYLRSEHLTANSALVEVLKNGERRVTAKKIREHHPISKKYVVEFTLEHPEQLKQYKAQVKTKDAPLPEETIESKNESPKHIDFIRTIDTLKRIPSGRESAHAYHDHILGALSAIFYPELINPIKENSIHAGRKKIDITFENNSREGFFYRASMHYKILGADIDLSPY